ncbi:RadC family protein [Solemya velum gill symbiont]|uniref:MPN domain-containing protein n=1 Tax=Solemya velum gill symbiont TaxID=2340 RepID=A0A1T2CNL7_SOVGS|nr:DNA repair protein RadC [Solemya velum gill symbiont]OOY33809.1 hypothetical protein BOV88_13295 [Solemya velum gill symbiont]OOY36465.1 hypothetical protein BOV89_12425 [Solemya velum gill symbiont]OOY38888.1 hypothetical protein BOV90_12245 [Solemya velum gill symbiont]OOY45330.1 hypothetical protein BOV93_13370 [Solemya velum gill symbiont]OOY49104.1 hypothetical protein BOV94_12365 [Solemya velum gill symbiont]
MKNIHLSSVTYITHRPVTAEDIIAEALGLLETQLRAHGDISLTSPETVKDYLKLRLAAREREIFGVLLLDTRHRLIRYEELFHGTIDSATVHPREVVKAALQHNAAAVIFTHNHPSGLSDPSEADKMLTQKLIGALSLIDVRVLDHLIVGADEPYSFAEHGLL